MFWGSPKVGLAGVSDPERIPTYVESTLAVITIFDTVGLETLKPWHGAGAGCRGFRHRCSLYALSPALFRHRVKW